MENFTLINPNINENSKLEGDMVKNLTKSPSFGQF